MSSEGQMFLGIYRSDSDRTVISFFTMGSTWNKIDGRLNNGCDEANRRFARYCELANKQDRTEAETAEMKRLLYQNDLFFAEKDGKSKDQFLEGRQAVARFHKRARELGVSEVGFVIGGAAASFFADGECYSHFDSDATPLEFAQNELKAADLWPWGRS